MRGAASRAAFSSRAAVLSTAPTPLSEPQTCDRPSETTRASPEGRVWLARLPRAIACQPRRKTLRSKSDENSTPGMSCYPAPSRDPRTPRLMRLHLTI